MHSTMTTKQYENDGILRPSLRARPSQADTASIASARVGEDSAIKSRPPRFFLRWAASNLWSLSHIRTMLTRVSDRALL